MTASTSTPCSTLALGQALEYSTFCMEMIRANFNATEEPQAVDDLSYDELVAMIEVICDPDTDEEVSGYYIGLIDCTLPGAEVSELIFWPNSWFRDEAMSSVDLSPPQIANYLLAWTEAILPGAEKIELPPIPTSKRDGPPRVIAL